MIRYWRYWKITTRAIWSARCRRKRRRPARRGRDRPIVIMLDPGHGGEDPGAIGKYKTREKDIVLQIARKLSAMIKREPNMKVFMTRNEDVFIPLKVRVAKARKQRADLFVSIHADAFYQPRGARFIGVRVVHQGAPPARRPSSWRRRRTRRTKLAASARVATATSTTPCLI